MHTVDLGVWVHLLLCIACKYDATLRKYGLLSHKEVMGVWDRLASRVRDLDQDECMFKINSYKGDFLKHKLMERLHANKKKKPKKTSFEAWEHHLLMNVSIVCCAHIKYTMTDCLIL